MIIRKAAVVSRIAFVAGALLLLVNTFLLVPLNVDTATPTAAAAGLQKVVVTIPAMTVVFVPFYLGKELGFYKGEGIDLEIMIMRSDVVSAGLVSGEVHYGTPLSNYVHAAAAGTPIKLVMSIQHKGEYTEFMMAKGFTSIEQLKGQIIGITARNGNLHLISIAILKAHGVSEKEVTFISYPGASELMYALEVGAVKAATMPPPYNIFMSRKGFRILGHGPDYYYGHLIGLVTSEKYIRDSRPAVVAMIRATLRTLRYIKENPTESTDFIEKHQRTPDREVAKKLYEMMADIGSKDGDITEQWVQDRLVEMKQFGGTPKVDDPRKILDLGPLQEARAGLKY